jgi:hypothetical protein
LKKNLKQAQRRVEAAAKAEAKKKLLDEKKAKEQKDKEWRENEKTAFDINDPGFIAVKKLSGKDKHDYNNHDLSTPLLITDVSEIDAPFTADATLKTHFAMFQMGWPRNALYSSKGKATAEAREVDSKVKPQPVSKLMEKYMPKHIVIDAQTKSGDARADDRLQMLNSAFDLFAFAGNRVTNSLEQNGMASLRYQHAGSRIVICVGRLQFTKFLDEYSPSKLKEDELAKKIGDMLEQMSEQCFKVALEKGLQIFKVEVPPKSILYMPPGFVVTSKAASADVFGTMVYRLPRCCPALVETFQFLLSLVSDSSSPSAKLLAFAASMQSST